MAYTVWRCGLVVSALFDNEVIYGLPRKKLHTVKTIVPEDIHIVEQHREPLCVEGLVIRRCTLADPERCRDHAMCFTHVEVGFNQFLYDVCLCNLRKSVDSILVTSASSKHCNAHMKNASGMK